MATMKLLFREGILTGTKYRVYQTVSIGRHASNDIVVADPAVSQVHCRISLENGRAVVLDQGSTNGVYLNGKRVINAELHDGDALLLGENTIFIEMGLDTVPVGAEAHETPAAEKAPEKPPGSDEEIKELSHSIFGSVTYYLDRKIADGGMGAVYEAHQFGAEGFTKKVAIKTILPSFAKKDAFISSFVGEAKLVANLVHQNIVQTHHLGRHENGYYIAMEYIDGISLTEFIRLHDQQGRTISSKIATFIVSRVCRGLEYAHTKCDESGKPLGLVHRDVSPNNIMIATEGEVKLTDFGVAKAAQFMKEVRGELVGCPEYMSPEQAGCTVVDGRSDLYSLGLVYFELLTGIRVFDRSGKDIKQALHDVTEGKIPDPREYRQDLPDSVVEILMKTLQKDPKDRYQTAAEMAFALETDLYSEGYGPTIVSLARYVERLRRK